MAASSDLPAYLPPRRPMSVLDHKSKGQLSRSPTPPYLPPRRLIAYGESRDTRSFVSGVFGSPAMSSAYRLSMTATREVRSIEDFNEKATVCACEKRTDSPQGNEGHENPVELRSPSLAARPHSLHCSNHLMRTSRSCTPSIAGSHLATPDHHRARSQPIALAAPMYREVVASSTGLTPRLGIPDDIPENPEQPPPLQQPSSRQAKPQRAVSGAKPRTSFTRLSSYDNVRTYQEEKAAWKRASLASSLMQQAPSEADERADDQREAIESEREVLPTEDSVAKVETRVDRSSPNLHSSSHPSSVLSTTREQQEDDHEQPLNRFRHFVAEAGFCFTIAMTQLLSEYVISGFAIELPRILNRHAEVGGLGQFWPASLLSLILSATLLIFARISDMYGGYLPFMFGVIWLGVWSLVGGFAGFGTLLDVARAMQGLAVASFLPSTFAMIGSLYPEGPRKNLVLGLYSGCAPLGFFTGFLVAAALPESAPGWFFWIVAALSFISAITAWLTIPHDRTDRNNFGLKMDWTGAMLITCGLILISYALAVEPYANTTDPSRSGWTFPSVLAPLSVGIACLACAFWVEGWHASCPLLPFDFFAPNSIKAFSLACLCFYATYGVWLYESAQFFQSPSATGTENGIRGVTLAAWYTPTAVGGMVLCVTSGGLLHIIPVMGLLLLSALAWIAAPLLLALCPQPVSYWAYVMPSMLCATLGIDLTFTISVVFLTSVQPQRYQGLAGAVSSILVNLAISVSLSISEIVSKKAKSTISNADENRRELWGYQAAFIYAAASAAAGLLLCALFVRISHSVVRQNPAADAERSRSPSEASTLVDV